MPSTESSASRRPAKLRALTFLAPGIPLGFFRAVTAHLAEALGVEIRLESESRSSGPMHGDRDPFAEGRADLGFLCSPSYLYLRTGPRPSVELVPAGFVFRDSRHDGEPVYFSDVIVRLDDPARSFLDLAGRAWGYNDECSLSGHFAALQRLAELRCDADFFGRRVRTGSHHASLCRLLSGEIDGASIDSTVLSATLRAEPELRSRLRLLDSWGPFPVQPVVTSSRLGRGFAERVAEALRTLPGTGPLGRALIGYGLEGCAPLAEEAFAAERRALQALPGLGLCGEPVVR